MDDSGNILIKRIAKSNVYVKSTEVTNGQVKLKHITFRAHLDYVTQPCDIGHMTICDHS